MKLENQVCTFEQGVYFEENDINLKSHLIWVEHQDGEGNEYKIWERKFIENHTQKKLTDYYCPAYSCAELGVLLPSRIEKNEVTFLYELSKSANKSYIAEYASLNKAPEFFVHIAHNNKYEAHAKADLLIHLLKEKIINPKDLTLED